MAGFRRDNKIGYCVSWVRATGKNLTYNEEDEFVEWLVTRRKMPEEYAREVFQEWNRYENTKYMDSCKKFLDKQEAKKKFNERFENIEKSIKALTEKTEKAVKAEKMK